MNFKQTINGVVVDLYKLLEEAREASRNAYVPYSKFPVGAAIISLDGKIYRGCNIENASYGLTCCAERTAIFSAATQGMRNMIAIAVVANTEKAVSPCGACRQVIREFAHPELVILLGNNKDHEHEDFDAKFLSMEELLPYSFGPEHLI